jgi:hypothetical protein
MPEVGNHSSAVLMINAEIVLQRAASSRGKMLREGEATHGVENQLARKNELDA